VQGKALAHSPDIVPMLLRDALSGMTE